MSNVLEVKNLSYKYQGETKEALHDLSFSIPSGSYVAIVGHNGSGKSTLAKIIAGLCSYKKGSVKLFDEELKKANITAIRQRMGLVFQNPDNQFVGASVRDDLAFGLENRQVPTEKMDEIIYEYAKKVSMEKYLDSAPENLSGGQKQRVAIAGVLAMKPELIIYDEATSMLDPVGKKDILDITFGLRNENPDLSVISITHDIEEASRADYVLVLNGGKLILEGKPSEVFSSEESLREIRLDAPFALSLIGKLRKEGVNVPKEVSTLKELENFLCQSSEKEKEDSLCQ